MVSEEWYLSLLWFVNSWLENHRYYICHKLWMRTLHAIIFFKWCLEHFCCIKLDLAFNTHLVIWNSIVKYLLWWLESLLFMKLFEKFFINVFFLWMELRRVVSIFYSGLLNEFWNEFATNRIMLIEMYYLLRIMLIVLSSCHYDLKSLRGCE